MRRTIGSCQSTCAQDNDLCLARYHFHARDTEIFSKPLGLVVDPINNCNLACPGCVHSARSTQEKLFQWSSGMLSEARFEALLRRYGVAALESARVERKFSQGSSMGAA